MQLKKISEFTEKLVKQLRSQTKALHARVSNAKAGQEHEELMQARTSQAAGHTLPTMHAHEATCNGPQKETYRLV